MSNFMNGEDRLGYTAVMRYNDEPLILDWWQRDYIQRDDRFYNLVKSRRTGWSFIISAKGVIKAQEKARKKYTKIFISYNLDDAMEKITYCKELYHSIPDKYKKPLASDNKTSMTFWDAGRRTESRLISFPCKAPRGKAGDVSLDEFAFQQGADRIYTGSLPAIIRGGFDMEIGSTPFGQKGRFYEIFSDKRTYPQYKRFYLPWWYSAALCKDVARACADTGLSTEELVMKWGNEAIQLQFLSMPFEDFEQEFCCSFRDEQAAYITLDMIRACTPVGDEEIPVWRNVEEALLGRPWSKTSMPDWADDRAESADCMVNGYSPETHGTLYAGFDVGRTRDASELIVVSRKEGQPSRLVMKETWLKTSFDDQEQRLNRVMHELPIHRLCIDSTGLGAHLAENLQKKWGRRVEPIIFNTESKEALAQGLYLVFQRHEILLPPDRELQRQIHAIKKTITASGGVRFDADREGTSHADQFWSLALAVSAGSRVETKQSNFYQQRRELQGVSVEQKQEGGKPTFVVGPGRVLI